MAQINKNFLELNQRYLFALITERTKALNQNDLINLGIGDVARPILPEIAEAISLAAFEMTRPEGIHGYGPETGYSFLKKAILEDEYGKFGFDEDEIFISEGINPELTTFHELFHTPLKVAIQDPTYPAYFDTNVIAGNIHPQNPCVFLPCCEENGFLPSFPNERVDLIYLCSPNNPTGTALNRATLQRWVNYAKDSGAVILFDGAYSAFVQSSDIPRSIFEVDGAEEVAIEFRSFSKSAGFTGLRCGYVVCPKKCIIQGSPINELWTRYKTIRSNGVSYPIQRAAQKTFEKDVQKNLLLQVQSYLDQTSYLKAALESLGFECYGGVHIPYIFLKVLKGMTSWEFFDYLLDKYGIISIPGSGFGKSGEGFIRLSGFITEATFLKAKNKFSTLAKQFA